MFGLDPKSLLIGVLLGVVVVPRVRAKLGK